MSAVVLFLGGFDHMKVDEQDREQVDSEREKAEAREGEEKRRQSKQTTNAQTCDDVCISDFLSDTRCDTLSHNVMCTQGQICREKLSCEVYLSLRKRSSLLEVRILDDLLQRGSDLRIQHLNTVPPETSSEIIHPARKIEFESWK